jgi:type II secretory pathway component PulJ
VELAVALAIFTVIIGGVLMLWVNLQNTYFAASERAEVQGDVRLAVDQMTRDIAKAGRDVLQCAFDSEAYTQCSGAKLTRCRALASLGAAFTCAGIFIIPSATSTSIQVQMDLDADGLIDTSAPSEESVTYAFDSVNRRITRKQGTGTARTLAENIQSLALTYEGPQAGATGVCTGAWGTLDASASQTNRDCIQRVNITVVAQGSVGQIGASGQQTIQRTIETSVDLRTR